MGESNLSQTRRPEVEFSTELIGKIVALMMGEISEWVQDESGAGALELEEGLREGLLGVGAACLKGALESQDERYPQHEVNCRCGQKAKYVAKREAKTLSVFGWVSYRRAYYVCPHCHKGQSPLDHRLGLRPGQVSVALASLVALEAIDVSFDQASRKIEQLLLVKVAENTVRKVTEDFGELQAHEEEALIEESQDVDNLIARRRSISDPPKRLYGALDGVLVPVDVEYRELKCGCYFETEERGRASPSEVGDTSTLRATQISYFCDLTDAAGFRDLVWAEGYRRAADRAEEIVFVADGAAWIWKLVEYHFPKATQIVDWYHAAAYLKAIAEAAYEDNDAAGDAWLERARTQLWEGQIDQIIATCREHEEHTVAAPLVHKAISYYTNNRKRMDYGRLRKEGYQIGSGNVESACKQIGTQRLKRAGARWSEPGARYTAKARAVWLSHEWPSLVQRCATLARAA
jgi:hypothetical protein